MNNSSVSIKKLTNAFLMPGMAYKAILFFRRFAQQARVPSAGILIKEVEGSKMMRLCV